MNFKRGINTKRALDLGLFSGIQFVIISISGTSRKFGLEIDHSIIRNEATDFSICIDSDNKLKMDTLECIKEKIMKSSNKFYKLKRAWITFEGNDRLPIGEERNDEIIDLVIPDDYDMRDFCFNMKL